MPSHGLPSPDASTASTGSAGLPVDVAGASACWALVTGEQLLHADKVRRLADDGSDVLKPDGLQQVFDVVHRVQ